MICVLPSKLFLTGIFHSLNFRLNFAENFVSTCAVFKVRVRLPLILRMSRSYAGRYPSKPTTASRMLRILPHGQCPDPFAAASPSLPDRPSNGLPSVLYRLRFGFEVSCEPSKRYREQLQSDLPICIGYINWSYGSGPSFDFPLPAIFTCPSRFLLRFPA